VSRLGEMIVVDVAGIGVIFVVFISRTRKSEEDALIEAT